MRVAALYDIHGNLPALEAVLREVEHEGVDTIVIGGDVVPGPLPRETLSRLRALPAPVHFIRGNGDREVVAAMSGRDSAGLPEVAREAIRWTAAQLDADDARVLAAWPPTCHLDIDGVGPVLFCHATPRSDTGNFTRETPDERLQPLFAGLDGTLVVCGHTHMPFDRMVGTVRVVNAGSVGMPFGPPGASWLLLDPTVALRHTDYDLEAAARRIRASDYPQAESFAARSILHPPSEDEMLAVFARAASR